MRLPKISLTFIILLFAPVSTPFTFTLGASLGASQVLAQSPSKTKANPLQAQKVQQPDTSNIQALEEAFEVKYLPSASMEPTLHSATNSWEADWILVDKLAYRSQSPKRGDMILFEPTEELLKEEHKDLYIKRIIALPGEKVELKDGKVYIDNQPLQEDKYLSPTQHTSVNVCTSGQQPPFLSIPQTIPPDSYLVLGDNRNSSYDSRCWGVVKRKNIVSQAVRIVKPPVRERELDETRNSQQRSAEDLFLKNICLLSPDGFSPQASTSALSCLKS